ncbi:hypothetical protein [Kutzneria buriramensis]|uniref:Uncharacterized protein n=1 Tax=Kutzneria buriramensis TaxID=1045776 RepID=A0A3E0HFN5_9PSEU|nr:hypothetical protein [Kutzneria buriramensis]REH43615.1 hypothetical protein BCF44_109158 [Kutzneria buriramensis]
MADRASTVDGVLHAVLSLVAFAAWLIIACCAVAAPAFAIHDRFGPIAGVVTAQVCAALVVAAAITWCARHLRTVAAATPACTCLDSPRPCRLHRAPELVGRHRREDAP